MSLQDAAFESADRCRSNAEYLVLGRLPELTSPGQGAHIDQMSVLTIETQFQNLFGGWPHRARSSRQDGLEIESISIEAGIILKRPSSPTQLMMG